ncbi:MAG TPA: hypothetical protein VJ801_01540 [Polyangia bacterium]|jgi:hypothetical protein|nr:hypothetical protein [Polyangia bacterium]
MMWPIGLALQQNKLTTTVFHKAQFVVLEGHDCGNGIPHITVPPANLNLPLDIAFSKRKVMFSSSKVKANGAQIACTELAGPPVPLPMLCCGSPVSLPNGFPSFNSLHTVSVGLSIGDIVAGFIAIAGEILGEVLCGRWRLKDGGLAGLAAKLVGASTLQEWALKQALGVLSGCARIAATRDGKLKVEVGSGYAGADVSLGYAREGRLKLGTEAHAADLKLDYAYAINPDGTTSHKFTSSEGKLAGADSTQYTTTSGSKHKPAEQKLQTTSTRGTVNVHIDRPSDTTAVSGQQTTTTTAQGSTTTTTASYAGSSPAESWGLPL